METFQNEIKEWVHLDSRAKILADELKQIREKKNNINSNIFEFVQSNQLTSSTIKITDGRLKFIQSKQTAPITLGFLEECLTELIKNNNTVDQYMDYIKSKRQSKYNSEIKRYYDN
jgi:hypothetical protein